MSSAPLQPGLPVATLRAVSKTFGEVRALHGLDLDVPAGLVGVLGPNGAGKSTLFRLLLGLEVADAGEVQVLGLAMPDAALEVRARLGYMPEDDSLFPGLTGIDQVLHAAQLCGLQRIDAVPRAHQALDLCGLSDARYRPALTYSLGMRQRLRLAMAVVHGPRLLLLDEPTAGLDPDGRAHMLELVKEIAAAGTSVLLSTHVLADVEAVCDEVVLLSRGQLGFVGPMQRFRAGTGGSSYRIRVVGDAPALCEALRRNGLGAELDGGDLIVQMQPQATQLFWQIAADGGYGIARFAPAEEDMSQAFVRHLRLDDPLRRGRTSQPGGAS